MAHGKHQSRSSNYGANPQEIADDDGYATYTPTLCSRATTTAAPSPALAKSLMESFGTCDLFAMDERLQDFLEHDKGVWTASETLASSSSGSYTPGQCLGSHHQRRRESDGPAEWNPIEGLWRARTPPSQYAAALSNTVVVPAGPRYSNDPPAFPSYTRVTDAHGSRGSSAAIPPNRYMTQRIVSPPPPPPPPRALPKQYTRRSTREALQSPGAGSAGSALFGTSRVRVGSGGLGDKNGSGSVAEEGRSAAKKFRCYQFRLGR
ncbi:hypothetical protein LTR36_001314 [Oleoguttula mirabilis]|uniref:Uncharacterized protein n=1 Tax=Oleoguttula mirabilis TaxID=1507867 RepID=A0AAV9JNF4_9PEZI|nr:hypothetical protein LTR36_001314 [Oleoguttula mirabilis]